MTIKTEHVYPPIPTRAFDWAAWDDDTADEGMLIGRGPTEQAAIADLKASLDEADEQPLRCPRCGSERIGGPFVAFNSEPYGETHEDVYWRCLEQKCQAKFDEEEAD